MKKIIPVFARRISVGGILAALLCTASAFAAEDEWYDPTDWFDGNNIESDDTLGYYDYSNYSAYDGDWGGYNAWGVDDWGPEYYDSDYWNRYDWNNGAQTASTGTASNASSSSKSGNTGQSTSVASAGNTSASGNGGIVYSYILFTAPANSQQSQQQQNQGGQSQAGQRSGQGSDDKQVAHLNGTIEGLRQMNLQRRSGATGTHTVAKIKLENGKTSVVSLGRSSKLADLNLQVGDKIEAVGTKGMIDGETVFVANRIRAKGQSIAANPAIRLKETPANQTAQTQNQNQAGGMTSAKASQAQASLQGEVASISRAPAGQASKQRTLVQIKLEDGKTSTVDLGPAASLDKIGLNEGDNISVQGHRTQVNGQDVLVADLLKIDGEKVSSAKR